MIVGPIDPNNGFPMWYKDENGLKLALNANPLDPLSGLAPQDLPDPSSPVSFPGNFPAEAFYMLAEAEMTTGTGERARLVLALEAAFAEEVPRDGDQMVFGRVRIRVDGLRSTEEYVVTHPYGTDTFIAEVADDDEPEVGEINFTQDIGVVQDFASALESRVHPFLQWDPAATPSPPEGYIGNPDIPHAVIGSVFTDETGEPQNIFRIQGRGIGIGSPDASQTPGFDPDNTIETRLFTLAGKISAVSGFDIERVNYSRIEEETGFIDIFATSDTTPQDIQVSGEGLTEAGLIGSNGVYFARTDYTGAIPPEVTIRNVTDIPVTVKTAVPVDFVWAEAMYDTDSSTLTVISSSSDEFANPELTVSDFGNGAYVIPGTGTLTVSELDIVPDSITVVSSAGGMAVASVVITGGSTDPLPVTANAGSGQTVLWGSEVTLNGSNSTGAIVSYSWIQVSGEPVTLTGADTPQPSFTAPSLDGSLEFQLTVFGPEGNSDADTVTVTVIESAPPPEANAGPDQSAAVGSIVTLSGSASGDVSSYLWEQVSGPDVTLSSPTEPVTTFTFPNQQATLVFELTVTGPGGSSSDSVSISSEADNLTITRAEFRTRDSEWRISGTTDAAAAGVTVTIYLGEDLNGTVLAETFADGLGNWEYRVEGSAIAPDASRSISVQSSAGGTLLDIPVNIRQ
ncbi:PKD domain-containing protein [Bacillus sp. AK031]